MLRVCGDPPPPPLLKKAGGADVSPDDEAQRDLCQALARTGGSFEANKQYPANRMNELVYPVHGGMEDWAYAGSWDLKLATSCRPANGYPPERTRYANATLRAFNVLVEASGARGGGEAESARSLPVSRSL